MKFQILYFIAPYTGVVNFIHSDLPDCQSIKSFKADFESLFVGSDSKPELYCFEHMPVLPKDKSEDEYDFDAEQAMKVICKRLWQEFGNVPVDHNGTDGAIEEPFLHFSVGTEVYTVWYWFEDEFNISIHSLMFPD